MLPDSAVVHEEEEDEDAGNEGLEHRRKRRLHIGFEGVS